MADLVSDGAEFSCNFCTSKLKLTVITSSSTGDSQKLANETNCLLPPPGGNCTLISGAPPPPCVGAPKVAKTGQTTVKVDGQTALGEGCEFMCPLGQSVTLSKAGQEVAKHDEASTALQVLSLVLDVLPVIGSGKSIVELGLGEDPVTDEEVSRWSSAVGIALGLIPGGKLLIKGKKAAKIAEKAMKKNASKTVSKQASKANDQINTVSKAANNNNKFKNQLEKQYQKDGEKSIRKSYKSLSQKLKEHEDKLPNLEYKSSVEREIRTFKDQITTLEDFAATKTINLVD